MTAYSDTSLAFRASKHGAVAFLNKPLDIDRLEFEVKKALEVADMENIVERYKEGSIPPIIQHTGEIIGTSQGMKAALNMARIVASAEDTTVLITGETGTGKELLANFIHSNSVRAKGPFISINCGAIPRELAENELFGHEKGAFTGASDKIKSGRFEQAQHGTILLDEIGELPLHLQSKILRVLQEGEFYLVGGTQPVQVDVRIIAATNSSLEDMIAGGTFRKDLYYRLSVIQMNVPSLYERREDIPYLIRHFLSMFNEKYELKKELTFEAIEYLKELPFDGNVRDLQNTVERIVLLSNNNIIGLRDLSLALNPHHFEQKSFAGEVAGEAGHSLKSLVSHYEKELLQTYWNEYKSASKIAVKLKTNQPSISRKLHAYEII